MPIVRVPLAGMVGRPPKALETLLMAAGITTEPASRVAPQGSSFKFFRTGVSSWKGCSVVPPRATSPLKAAEEHHQLMARANHKEETVRTDAQTDTANTVCAINEVNERVTVRRRDCKREECDTLKHRHCVKVRQ